MKSLKCFFTSSFVMAAVAGAVAAEAPLIAIRADSYSRLSGAIGELSMALDQPMYGAMAMTAMSTQLGKAFGAFDRNQPLALVLVGDVDKMIAKVEAKNSSDGGMGIDIPGLFGMGDIFNDAAPAVIVPFADKAAYIASITNAFGGKVGDGVVAFDPAMSLLGMASIKDGFAVLANSPDTASVVAALRDDVMAPRDTNANIGIVVYNDLMKIMAASCKKAIELSKDAPMAEGDTPEEMLAINDLERGMASALTDQLVALEMMRDQMETLFVGLGFEAAKGLTVCGDITAIPGSPFAAALAKPDFLDDAAYAAIPDDAAAFAAYNDPMINAMEIAQYGSTSNTINRIVERLKDAKKTDYDEASASFVNLVAAILNGSAMAGNGTISLLKDDQGRYALLARSEIVGGMEEYNKRMDSIAVHAQAFTNAIVANVKAGKKDDSSEILELLKFVDVKGKGNVTVKLADLIDFAAKDSDKEAAVGKAAVSALVGDTLSIVGATGENEVRTVIACDPANIGAKAGTTALDKVARMFPDYKRDTGYVGVYYCDIVSLIVDVLGKFNGVRPDSAHKAAISDFLSKKDGDHGAVGALAWVENGHFGFAHRMTDAQLSSIVSLFGEMPEESDFEDEDDDAEDEDAPVLVHPQIDEDEAL